MKTLFVLFITAGSLCFTSCTMNNTSEKTITPEQRMSDVAKAYGMDSMPDMGKLSFTFNLQKDTVSFARNWVWDVKNNIVSLTTQTENITYKRDTIQSKEMKNIDAKFINDQYWLLFPMHAVKDSGVSYTMKDSVYSPIGKNIGKMVTVQYNKGAGYTPGDAYDLYIDNNNLIKEWSYRPGGVAEPALTTTWENNAKEGGMLLAMDHKNAKGDFRIFFTGVRVE